MNRFVLAAIALSWGLSAASAESTWLIGSFDAGASETRLAAALASSGEEVSVQRLDAPEDARGVAVFRAFFGEEGSRIQRVRKLAALGLVGFPVGTPDPCQLDLTQRSDAVALTSQAAEAAQRAASAAQLHYEDLSFKAEEARIALEALEVVIAQDEVELANAENLHTAAHEAAHVVQQKAGVSLRVFQQRPSRESLSALISVAQELAVALQKEQSAADAENAAVAKLSGHRQEFGPVQNRRKESARLAAEAGNTADAAASEAAGQWKAAGALVNLEIQTTAGLVVDEAQALADVLAELAGAVATAKASYGGQTGIGHPNYLQLEAIEWAVSDAAALAADDAKRAVALLVSARQLPPLARTSSDAEAEKLPQFLLLDAIALASDANDVNGMVVAMGVIGGSSSNAVGVRLSEILESACSPAACSPEIEAGIQVAQNYQTLTLQMAMQREAQAYQSISNVLKTKHDTAKNSIGNIR